VPRAARERARRLRREPPESRADDMGGQVDSYGVADAERNSAAAPAEATAEPAEARLLRRVGAPPGVPLRPEVARRGRLPWDIMLWAESPFMVNILKLHAGQPIFSPPGDVNSFVYSPGLEYLAYALLAPFDLALDVRWCRAVNVGLGFAAAAVAAFAG